jgi:hypothetical protein
MESPTCAFNDAIVAKRTPRDNDIYVRKLLGGTVRFDGFLSIDVAAFTPVLRTYGMTATYRLCGANVVVECSPSKGESLDCVSVHTVTSTNSGITAENATVTAGGSVDMHCFALPTHGVAQSLLDAIAAHPSTLTIHIDARGLRVCVSRQSAVANGLVATLMTSPKSTCALGAARRPALGTFMKQRATKQNRRGSHFPYQYTQRRRQVTL